MGYPTADTAQCLSHEGPGFCKGRSYKPFVLLSTKHKVIGCDKEIVCWGKYLVVNVTDIGVIKVCPASCYNLCPSPKINILSTVFV